MARVLFVLNNPAFFLSHRLPLALGALRAGYDVHLVAPSDSASELEVQRHGIAFHPWVLSRSGARPWEEARTVWELARWLRTLRPDVVHAVTIKPVIYAGMLSRALRVPASVSAVSGLGYVFLAKGFRADVVRSIVRVLYRAALEHKNGRVIFQNPDDERVFLEAGLVRAERIVRIRGSGVDTTQFSPTPEGFPQGVPVVVVPARMLVDKGIVEFVEAARILRARGVPARLALVGDTDAGNPAALTAEQLRAWQREGLVEWWGFRRDMPEVFRGAHVACLPSYREGLPKALLEAMACGLPIVTTDAPGCREVVEPSENGFLVPVRTSEPLADALETLLRDPELRAKQGARSRALVLEHFSVEGVVEKTLAVYRELLAQV